MSDLHPNTDNVDGTIGPADLINRWARYAMKMECKACGEAIYAHEEDARSDIKHILSINDFGPKPSVQGLRDALTWLGHGGKYCDYHTEQLTK